MDDGGVVCPVTGSPHEWAVQGVHLAREGGAVWLECRWCDELRHVPGVNYRSALAGEVPDRGEDV